MPQPELEPINELHSPIHPETLAPDRDAVRAEMVTPALERVHTNMEWEPAARTLESSAQEELTRFVDAYDAPARAKAPAERDGFDNFLLAMSRNAPADITAPEDSILTPYGYYVNTGERVADALAEGKIPEGFENIDTLEKTTAFLLVRGLVGLSRHPDRSDPDLRAALDIMCEATQRVPGYNPLNAGLWHLLERSIGFNAALRQQPRYQVTNHMGRQLAARCLETAVTVIATTTAPGP